MSARIGGAGLAALALLGALCALCGGAGAAEPAAAGATPAPSPSPATLTLRLHSQTPSANRSGPLAQAGALQASLAVDGRPQWLTEVEWQPRLPSLPGALTLGLNLLAWQGRAGGQVTGSGLRVNELQLSGELAGWAFNIGKLVVAWDVGQGFRPNDLVQQAQRRKQLDATLEGRPLLQLEHFGSDQSSSLVWVNPQRLQHSLADAPGADESALALRHYRRFGAADGFAFVRHGRHTGSSLGAAGAWVASDSLALHASLRWLQRHAAWASDGLTAGTLLAASPWHSTLQGAARQALLGLTWTGQARQSLLAEAWYDGSALPPAGWRSWATRNAALTALPAGAAPGAAVAGNLAWQASPLSAPTLQRQNLLLRAAWQPERWTHSLVLLRQPADGGLSLTAATQWQGERWRLDASLRRFAGPAGAVLRRLPQRQTLVLAASANF